MILSRWLQLPFPGMELPYATRYRSDSPRTSAGWEGSPPARKRDLRTAGTSFQGPEQELTRSGHGGEQVSPCKKSPNWSWFAIAVAPQKFKCDLGIAVTRNDCNNTPLSYSHDDDFPDLFFTWPDGLTPTPIPGPKELTSTGKEPSHRPPGLLWGHSFFCYQTLQTRHTHTHSHTVSLSPEVDGNF